MGRNFLALDRIDKSAFTCYHRHSFKARSHEVKREYPASPIVAVGVIIRDGDRIVLVRRNQEPSKGRWTFPGGAVELGESLQAAAKREAWEETALDVEVGEVAAVLDTVVRNETGQIRYHYVIIDYIARPVRGELRPGTDVSDARWVSKDELDVLDVTEKAGELARQLLA